jgi:hypothetical protein
VPDACATQPLDRRRTFVGSRSDELAQRRNQHGVEAVSLRRRQDVIDRALRQGFVEWRESSEEIDDKVGSQTETICPARSCASRHNGDCRSLPLALQRRAISSR